MGVKDKIQNARNTNWIAEGIPRKDIREIVKKVKDTYSTKQQNETNIRNEFAKLVNKHKRVLSKKINLDTFEGNYPIYTIDRIDGKVVKVNSKSHAENLRLFGFSFYPDKNDVTAVIEYTKEVNELISEAISCEMDKYIEENFTDIKDIALGDSVECNINK